MLLEEVESMHFSLKTSILKKTCDNDINTRRGEDIWSKDDKETPYFEGKQVEKPPPVVEEGFTSHSHRCISVVFDRIGVIIIVARLPILILAPPSLILDHDADCPETVILTILPLRLYGRLLLI